MRDFRHPGCTRGSGFKKRCPGKALDKGNVGVLPAPCALYPVRSRSGFSLLEVVLALAILTAAVAILGELIRSGLRNAQLARDLSKAELLCESTIYQIESGFLPPQPAQRAQIDQEPGWFYSIENESTGSPTQSGLLRLRVTVELNPDQQKRPTKFSVVRWMRDPSLVLAQQAQQMSVLPTTSSTTSSSSSSSTMGSGVF